MSFAGHREMFAFSATFFAFSLFTYTTLFALIHRHGHPSQESDRG